MRPCLKIKKKEKWEENEEHRAVAECLPTACEIRGSIASERFLYPDTKPLHWHNQSNQAELRTESPGLVSKTTPRWSGVGNGENYLANQL